MKGSGRCTTSLRINLKRIEKCASELFCEGRKQPRRQRRRICINLTFNRNRPRPTCINNAQRTHEGNYWREKWQNWGLAEIEFKKIFSKPQKANKTGSDFGNLGKQNTAQFYRTGCGNAPLCYHSACYHKSKSSGSDSQPPKHYFNTILFDGYGKPSVGIDTAGIGKRLKTFSVKQSNLSFYIPLFTEDRKGSGADSNVISNTHLLITGNFHASTAFDGITDHRLTKRG